MFEAKSILKFQIGPVQDFIAQARSTRDLWSGSYLLSWLVAAGIRKLRDEGGELIFPDRAKQPLLDDPLDANEPNLLTPNLPNIFVASVPADRGPSIAGAVKKAIDAEWLDIATAVWEQRQRFGLEDKSRFFAQVDRHLSISWQLTPLGDDYAAAYDLNGRHLDAVRQTRDFRAWDSASGPMEKDSLSGREEALVGGKDFHDVMKALAKRADPYAKLFAKHADHLGAVSIIKRVWHLSYLAGVKGIHATPSHLPIRSIPAIAARRSTPDNEDVAQERSAGDSYIAAIAFDGDSIGQWVSGAKLDDTTNLKVHHSAFSGALSNFALIRVRDIFKEHENGHDGTGQSARVPLGQLIYAGGDDVVALVPADAALTLARTLRDKFREATDHIRGKDDDTPDASAGIAIAHIHSPLQDLIREAQLAERRAKIEGPRPAFSITLMKRSGEISHWTARWDKGAVALHDDIFKAMNKKRLSAKFPHRLVELLTPYLTHSTGLAKQQQASAFPADEIITKEFRHTATRQGSGAIADELTPTLTTYLASFTSDAKDTDFTQAKLKALIGLATTVAFTFRNLPATDPQPQVTP